MSVLWCVVMEMSQDIPLSGSLFFVSMATESVYSFRVLPW